MKTAILGLLLLSSATAFADSSDLAKARAMFGTAGKPQAQDLLTGLFVGQCYSPDGTTGMLMQAETKNGGSYISPKVGIDFAQVSLEYANPENYIDLLISVTRDHTPPSTWAPTATETPVSMAFPGWEVKKVRGTRNDALVYFNGRETYCYATPMPVTQRVTRRR